VLEVEKIQLELEAKKLQDKLDHEKIVAEDLKAKGEEVKDIKEGKGEEQKSVESLNELDPTKTESAEDAEIRKLLEEDEELDPALRAVMEEEVAKVEPAKTGADILERRKDPTQRKLVSEMTPEEKTTALDRRIRGRMKNLIDYLFNLVLMLMGLSMLMILLDMKLGMNY
jgi:hypothetical protein